MLHFVFPPFLCINSDRDAICFGLYKINIKRLGKRFLDRCCTRTGTKTINCTKCPREHLWQGLFLHFPILELYLKARIPHMCRSWMAVRGAQTQKSQAENCDVYPKGLSWEGTFRPLIPPLIKRHLWLGGSSNPESLIKKKVPCTIIRNSCSEFASDIDLCRRILF